MLEKHISLWIKHPCGHVNPCIFKELSNQSQHLQEDSLRQTDTLAIVWNAYHYQQAVLDSLKEQ